MHTKHSKDGAIDAKRAICYKELTDGHEYGERIYFKTRNFSVMFAQSNTSYSFISLNVKSLNLTNLPIIIAI